MPEVALDTLKKCLSYRLTTGDGGKLLISSGLQIDRADDDH
jgi:hypothetical protein